jgi:hypothetical protein
MFLSFYFRQYNWLKTMTKQEQLTLANSKPKKKSLTAASAVITDVALHRNLISNWMKETGSGDDKPMITLADVAKAFH